MNNQIITNLPYACPQCKQYVTWREDALHCSTCQRDYPIRDGIPDFMLGNLAQDVNPLLRDEKSIDWLAHIYESKWWYPLALNLFGGLGKISLKQLVEIINDWLEPVKGLVLDVACGPGTFGRRAASPVKKVFGIDISLGMLRQGNLYAQRDHITNIHFSRAKVEALPFTDQYFDAAICCGSLHLFSDTVTALREIGRTLKPGALLVVFTFTAGNAGVLKYRRIREHIRKDHGVHVFSIPEITQYLCDAGFKNCKFQVYGSVLTFVAHKLVEG